MVPTEGRILIANKVKMVVAVAHRRRTWGSGGETTWSSLLGLIIKEGVWNLG